MRKMIFSLCVAIFLCAQACGAESSVSVRMEDANAEMALDAVGRALGARVVVAPDVKIEKRISIDAKGYEAAMDQICLELGLTWKREGDVINVTKAKKDS